MEKSIRFEIPSIIDIDNLVEKTGFDSRGAVISAALQWFAACIKHRDKEMFFRKPGAQNIGVLFPPEVSDEVLEGLIQSQNTERDPVDGPPVHFRFEKPALDFMEACARKFQIGSACKLRSY